jgi:small GTP-binding protein
MIKKKICVLGAFAVGKTSLIERYVNSVFSDKYHTTIGVKTDQKDVKSGDKNVRLIIWDINGEDDYQRVKPSYLTGASGALIIADGTRKDSLAVAMEMMELIKTTIGEKPFFLLINKSDLRQDWEITREEIEDLKDNKINVLITSAKTGDNVEKAFTELTDSIIENDL